VLIVVGAEEEAILRVMQRGWKRAARAKASSMKHQSAVLESKNPSTQPQEIFRITLFVDVCARHQCPAAGRAPVVPGVLFAG
jgi:hypothetical protein